MNHTYNCEYKNIDSGGTLTVDIDIGFGVKLTRRVKIRGIRIDQQNVNHIHEKLLSAQTLSLRIDPHHSKARSERLITDLSVSFNDGNIIDAGSFLMIEGLATQY